MSGRKELLDQRLLRKEGYLPGKNPTEFQKVLADMEIDVPVWGQGLYKKTELAIFENGHLFPEALQDAFVSEHVSLFRQIMPGEVRITLDSRTARKFFFDEYRLKYGSPDGLLDEENGLFCKKLGQYLVHYGMKGNLDYLDILLDGEDQDFFELDFMVKKIRGVDLKPIRDLKILINQNIWFLHEGRAVMISEVDGETKVDLLKLRLPKEKTQIILQQKIDILAIKDVLLNEGQKWLTLSAGLVQNLA